MRVLWIAKEARPFMGRGFYLYTRRWMIKLRWGGHVFFSERYGRVWTRALGPLRITIKPLNPGREYPL